MQAARKDNPDFSLADEASCDTFAIKSSLPHAPAGNANASCMKKNLKPILRKSISHGGRRMTMRRGKGRGRMSRKNRR